MASESLSRTLYDTLGPDWLAGRTTPPWDRQVVATLSSRLPSGCRVLDVGCGYGRIAIPLALRGHRVTGLDLSASLLERAKETAARASADAMFVCGSMTRLPLCDESFDVVICLWSAFHELLETEEQIAALREMKRVLVPGGWALVEGPLYQPASAEEISSGRRRGFEHRVSWDSLEGLPNPHFLHDEESFKRLAAMVPLRDWRAYIADWTGRPRQLFDFWKATG